LLFNKALFNFRYNVNSITNEDFRIPIIDLLHQMHHLKALKLHFNVAAQVLGEVCMRVRCGLLPLRCLKIHAILLDIGEYTLFNDELIMWKPLLQVRFLDFLQSLGLLVINLSVAPQGYRS
jgi:hypothetical protein